MSNFWSLVGFEYKKILRKRSVQAALLLAVLVTAFSVCGTLLGNYYVNGEVYESNYEAMVRDRAYERALAGRKLDEKLIAEEVNAYAKIPDSDRYSDTVEYQTFARPYSAVYSLVRAIYNMESAPFGMTDFQTLTEERADQLYEARRDKQVKLVEATNMSEQAKDSVLALDAQIETPFTIAYTDGYARFFVAIYTFGLTAAFVMAICIAPLFSGEYASGADQLILASKHGKNKLIGAKLFTGFSLAAAISLVLTTVGYFLSLFLFGFDGADVPLQLYMPMSPYPLTMKQTALILATCAFFACLMTAAITMLLSARLKSPFGVIILVGLLLIVPMFLFVPETNITLYNLFHLLPTNMMAIWGAAAEIQYELFGLVIKPCVFLPVFAAVISILLTPFAYRSFKKHQIV